MKFTLFWLKAHFTTDASLDQIVENLTRIGLEVESVDDPGKKLGAFTIAHVVSGEQPRMRIASGSAGSMAARRCRWSVVRPTQAPE